MSDYYFDGFYKAIGDKCIEEMPELEAVKLLQPRIGYVVAEKKKSENGKAVCASCKLVSDRDKTLWTPFDFVIEIYAPNVKGFNLAQKEILIWHELQHVGVDMTDAGLKCSIKPHDFEDFESIVSRFGCWWSDPAAEPDAILGDWMPPEEVTDGAGMEG